MPDQYIVLARHGQSAANASLQESTCGLYYSNAGSDYRVPLTAAGEREAAETGYLLAQLFPIQQRLAMIYHPPRFQRILQHVELIVQHLRYSIRTVESNRLRKRSYGLFWNLTHKGVAEKYPEEWEKYQRQGPLIYRPPPLVGPDEAEKGENHFDVFKRVDKFYRQT